MSLILFAAGCNSLPAGKLQAIGTESSLSRQGKVYLLRGWRGLWSEGVDTLAADLTAQQVEAHVFAAEQSSELSNTLLQKYRGTPQSDPLVLIGFSFGADEAIRIACKLCDAGIAVDLLITLDPVTPPKIPSGVRQCSNFYQSNGVWDALPWLRGVPVEAEPSAQNHVENVNIRDRTHLLEESTGHSTVAANAKLHRVIVQQVIAVCPVRDPGAGGVQTRKATPP